MTDADSVIEGFNPLCGDHYKVYLKFINGTIADVSFDGAGCAISKSSASVMTQIVKGKSKPEVDELFSEFHRLVRGELSGEEAEGRLGKLAVFSGVSEFPARVKCASLPWHTLKAAMEKKHEIVTTE